MKKFSAILLSPIALLTVFAMLGYRGLSRSIRNQRTCEWANIDNIEIHAHIDVPRVIRWDCNYEKANNIKKASFTIDKNRVDLVQYSQGYKLQKLTDAAQLDYRQFLHLNSDSLRNAELYYKLLLANGERSEVLYDKNTGRLWVTIQYKD